MMPFTYGDLRRGVRRYWRIMPCCVVACLLLAFVWLNFVTPKYTAEMVIGPVSRNGVAARGIRLPLQDANAEKIRDLPSELADDETLSDFARAMQLLTAPQIAEGLLADDTLDVREKMLLPHGVMHTVKTVIWRLAGQQPDAMPDAVTLARILAHDIHVEAVGRSAMRRVTFRHADRAFGLRLLDALYHATDSHLRMQAQSRTARETAYLRQSLESVTQNDQRRTLSDLLAAQEQIRLLLAVDLPFAADQIEPAHAATAPDWPDVGLTLFMALALGLFGGVSITYGMAVRAWLRQK